MSSLVTLCRLRSGCTRSCVLEEAWLRRRFDGRGWDLMLSKLALRIYPLYRLKCYQNNSAETTKNAVFCMPDNWHCHF